MYFIVETQEVCCGTNRCFRQEVTLTHLVQSARFYEYETNRDIMYVCMYVCMHVCMYIICSKYTRFTIVFDTNVWEPWP